MGDEKIYTYVSNSLNSINNEIQLQDKRTLLLFSYMYNSCFDINDKVDQFSYAINNNINLLNNNISYFNNQLNDINQHISKLEIRIGKLDKKIISIITFLEKYNNSNIKIDQNNKIYKRIYKYSKNFLKNIFKKIYNIIFYYKIKKEKEIEKLKQIENENNKLIKQKQIIKQILSNK